MELLQELELIKHVKIDHLEPKQRPTSRDFKVATDYYEQCMIKHPHRSQFHSKEEHLHAALLESDPSVTRFVPQPFLFRINKTFYPPDGYMVRQGKRIIFEIKPEKRFDKKFEYHTGRFMKSFCRNQGWEFEEITNESIRAQEIRANNWLNIIRMLVAHEFINTQAQERELQRRLFHEKCLTLHSIVDMADRSKSLGVELGLFRLAHRGIVNMDLDQHPLGLETQMSLA